MNYYTPTYIIRSMYDKNQSDYQITFTFWTV